MIAQTLARAAHAVDATMAEAKGQVAFRGVAIDSRSAQPGQLFFAIRGASTDGHRFLPQAADAGCAAAVVARDADLPAELAGRFPGGVLAVADTTEALGLLGAAHRRTLGGKVIGVTGSNGKTTVKRMIHHVLSARRRGTCSPKSFNNQWGVPLTLLAAEPGDDYIVCEIGTNAPGEIEALARLACPDIAVITCIAPTHLERLGDLAGVAREKASILQYVPSGGLGVVWADSDLLAAETSAWSGRRVRFGVADDADLRLTRREGAGWGQRYWVGNRGPFALSVPGRHNATNALAALAVAGEMGLPLSEAAEILSGFEGGDMRLERIEAGAVTIVNDAYNANPSSMLAAADVLAGVEGRRRVLIAGDMCELGPAAEDLHRQTGQSLAPAGVDLLIGVGGLGRYMAQGAAEEGLPVVTFATVDDACAHVADHVADGDVVLLKASRAVGLERLVEPLQARFGPAGSEAKGESR